MAPPGHCVISLEILDVVRRHEARAGVDVGFDLLAPDRLDDRIDPEFAHLSRELRDGRILDAGLDRFELAAAGVEADENERVVSDAGVAYRLSRTGGRRTAAE